MFVRRQRIQSGFFVLALALLFVASFWLLHLWIVSNYAQTVGPRQETLVHHRFGARMVVVVPFIHDQLPLLYRNLLHAWPKNEPCDPARGYNAHIDLYFYFNKDLSKQGAAVSKLRAFLNRSHNVSQCFAHVRFLSAGLSDEEDAYPLGPSHMFFKLWHLRTLRKQYAYMLYMEPDVLPCRSGWLDKVYEEAVVPGTFWIRGSLLRNGRNDVGTTLTFAQHINGNALYRLDSVAFGDYVREVYNIFKRDPKRFVESYDVALWMVMWDRRHMDWSGFTHRIHYFQYTPTIQNWYRTRVNATWLCQVAGSEEGNQVQEGRGETYLVHGKDVYL